MLVMSGRGGDPPADAGCCPQCSSAEWNASVRTALQPHPLCSIARGVECSSSLADSGVVGSFLC